MVEQIVSNEKAGETTDVMEANTVSEGKVEAAEEGTRNGASSTESLIHELEQNQLCVIPRDALLLILKDNAKCQQKANEINEHIAKTLEILSDKCVAAVNASKEDTCSRIVSKLDQLIVAINRNNSIVSERDEFDGIANELNERYVLMEQAVQCDKLSAYYKELLHEEIPYAPRKFRVKVSKDASEIELKHRRQQTIDAVNTEINIMEERVIDLREQIRALDEIIEEHLRKNENRRVVITEKIETGDRHIMESFENEYLAKRRNAYRKCKENCTEFLLIFVDEKAPRDSAVTQWNQNYRERYQSQRVCPSVYLSKAA